MMHDKSRKLNIKSRYSKGVSTCTVFRIDKLANSCNVMSAMDTSHALDSTHVIQRYYSHSLSNQTKKWLQSSMSTALQSSLEQPPITHSTFASTRDVVALQRSVGWRLLKGGCPQRFAPIPPKFRNFEIGISMNAIWGLISFAHAD